MSENKLTDLCEVSNGDTPPGEDGDVPVYGANGVIGSTDKTNFEGGIIVGRVGSAAESHYVDQPVWVSDNALTLSIKSEKYTEKYLYYFISSCKEELLSYAGIGVQPIINQKHLSWLEPPQVSLEEQERIVSLLSDVDEYIDKTSERIHALEQSKQAVLKRIFAVKGDDINTINPQYRWSSQLVGDVCSVTSGSSFPQNYQDGSIEGIPVIKVGDLQEELYINSAEFSVTKDDLDELGHTVYEPGTIILPKNGESIRTAKVNILESECAVDNNVMVLSVDSDSVLSEWVAYFLDYYELIRIAPGTTAPTISNKTMKALNIPVPPKSEQENVISLLSQIDEGLGRTTEDIESMRELKQGVLQNLFSV